VSGMIAREYIISHPLAVLSLAVKKAHVFLVYPITNTDSEVVLQAFAVVCDILLLAGVLAGLAACCRVPGHPWGLLAAIGFFTLAQLIFHAEARFRLPLVPLISLFAGVGISVFLNNERRKEILAVRGARRLLAVGGLVVLVVYGITGMMFSQGLL